MTTNILDIPISTHLKEMAVAISGFSATLFADVVNAPHWLTVTLGGLTAVYTLFKIGIVAITFRKKWRHRNDAETAFTNKDDETTLR